ncbi:MAG TPA: tRNA (adenosine(37)-N6)-threonylcarbamoyltransferase complex ATPase subunit type 1 TsaE [Streptosporangiaceae bacterium]|nr:tRNA (adenosine(37)-N6)-threonylcarbamoyltransferase complex ATPase subunit type 1 TsaE [Streptosporangiaceae bacterium]
MAEQQAAAAITARVAVPGAAQMRALGARLAAALRPGDLIVLTGALGAGKTTLAQGIGAGLAVRGPVTSPTFVIARVHPALRGGPDLVHADAYRLGSRVEVDDLDLDADLDRSVIVVEWGEGLVEYLAPGYLRITIDRVATARPAGHGAREDPGDEPRLVTVTGYGERWQAAAAGLVRLLAEPLGPPDEPSDHQLPAGRAVR